MKNAPYVSDYPRGAKCVIKTWHKPPGLAKDFRGYAVMDGDREVSVHARVTDAYVALDALTA